MKCTLSQEAGVICFSHPGRVTTDGCMDRRRKKTETERLVYLERHHADLIRDSSFFLRPHSLETMLCRTVFWVLAAPDRGHNNKKHSQTDSQSAELSPALQSRREEQAEAAGGRC